MTLRAINLEQNDVYDICDALNNQAAHFEELAAEADFSRPASAPVYRQKVVAIRAVTARVLSAWDAGKRSRVGSAA